MNHTVPPFKEEIYIVTERWKIIKTPHGKDWLNIVPVSPPIVFQEGHVNLITTPLLLKPNLPPCKEGRNIVIGK